MGNSCFGDNSHLKLNLCFSRQDVTYQADQVLIKEEDDQLITNDKKVERGKKKKKENNKMNELIIYFNEREKEIYNDYKKKGKVKKNHKKMQDHTIDLKEENKYELMLKRLLEQQNIKKNGPKRRETIRKDGDKIQEIVKTLLMENKKDVLQKTSSKDNSSLLIKKLYNKKDRFSVTLDRNILFTNNLNHNKNKFQEQYFNNRNTICEITNETNAAAVKKQNTNES